MPDEADEFFTHHKGGSGAVVVVQAFTDGKPNAQPKLGIFGSIETAHEWRRSLGDKFTCLFEPYIVDDPDWGNEHPTGGIAEPAAR